MLGQLRALCRIFDGSPVMGREIGATGSLCSSWHSEPYLGSRLPSGVEVIVRVRGDQAHDLSLTVYELHHEGSSLEFNGEIMPLFVNLKYDFRWVYGVQHVRFTSRARGWG